MNVKLISIGITLFTIFILFFLLNEKNNMPNLNNKTKNFVFDSTWYHKVEDSLWVEMKNGRLENGKVYTINGHKFSWTAY
jgi:hypothetical protein